MLRKRRKKSSNQHDIPGSANAEHGVGTYFFASERVINFWDIIPIFQSMFIILLCTLHSIRVIIWGWLWTRWGYIFHLSCCDKRVHSVLQRLSRRDEPPFSARVDANKKLCCLSVFFCCVLFFLEKLLILTVNQDTGKCRMIKGTIEMSEKNVSYLCPWIPTWDPCSTLSRSSLKWRFMPWRNSSDGSAYQSEANISIITPSVDKLN